MRKYRKFRKAKSLKELLEDNDIYIPKKTGEPILYTFEHFYNPWHLYSRLKELGINAVRARTISSEYEDNTYKRILEEVRNLE
ncbi:MAG: hypothetical protein KKC55_16285 [Gammaproteobacteria bacterium]|nr:hypothetical protein [Gammaproteobacteria bacterium]